MNKPIYIFSVEVAARIGAYAPTLSFCCKEKEQGFKLVAAWLETVILSEGKVSINVQEVRQ